MKKFMVIFVLTFLAVIGLNKYEGVAWAENDVEVEIDLHKYVSSDGESYDFEIEIDGEDVRKVKMATIKIPSGRKMTLKNSLGFNEIDLLALYGSYDEFNNKFPEGEYNITLFPKKYGRLKVDITHDFPSTPVITYPEDGATDVPLAPTIIWESLSNIDGFIDAGIYVEGDGGNEIEYEIDDLSKDALSYTFPSGLLQPNTEYELTFSVRIDIDEDEKETELSTSRVIRFTTGSE